MSYISDRLVASPISYNASPLETVFGANADSDSNPNPNPNPAPLPIPDPCRAANVSKFDLTFCLKASHSTSGT